MNAQWEKIAAATVSILGAVSGGLFLWCATLLWTATDAVPPEVTKAEAFINASSYIPISMWTIGGIAEYLRSVVWIVGNAVLPYFVPILGFFLVGYGILGLLSSLGVEPGKSWLPIGRAARSR